MFYSPVFLEDVILFLYTASYRSFAGSTTRLLAIYASAVSYVQYVHSFYSSGNVSGTQRVTFSVYSMSLKLADGTSIDSATTPTVSLGAGAPKLSYLATACSLTAEFVPSHGKIAGTVSTVGCVTTGSSGRGP